MPAARSRVQQWLLAWAGGRDGAESAEEEPRPVDLNAIRCQMIRAMRGCSEHHRARAADKVIAAASALELWMVRCDLYQFLARDIGELEASRRMDGLKGLFRGHVAMAAAPSHNPAHGHQTSLH